MKPRSTTRFAPADIPRFVCTPVNRERERRGSAAERGYDHEWSKLSLWHRRREPLCRICYFRGLRVPVEMVNHTIPVRVRPDLRLEKSNLSSTCNRCHTTIIRELERCAEQADDWDVLATWLTDPSTWPDHIAFQPDAIPRFLRHANRSPDAFRR